MELQRALQVLRERNRQGGVHPDAVAAFERMYRAYREGASGTVPWNELSPAEPEDIVSLEELDTETGRAEGVRRLGEVAWVVLNGGLGTSMRMDRAKSLLRLKDGETFLDLLCQHVLHLRRRYNVKIPLLFMNSFATQEDTLQAVSGYDLIVDGPGGRDLPLDFLQHRFPRIRQDDGLPYGNVEDRDAWAPPGHGNLYLALQCSGLLDELLRAGVRWMFVSNADNMGATLHPGLLGYLATHRVEFAMEVTAKTAADVKGGTLVRRGGRLQLLEIAQVEENHVTEFQDLGTFSVFNTNNLWVDLTALRRLLTGAMMELPLIVNRKRVGGVDVVQLETAMGAAIGQFEQSMGVLVPRDRFAPVKTTEDLLVRRSDVYLKGENAPLVLNPGRDPELGPPVVELDSRFYRSVNDLDLRFSAAPSLVRARSLRVSGDVRFGSAVQVVGDVALDNPANAPLQVPEGAVLSG